MQRRHSITVFVFLLAPAALASVRHEPVKLRISHVSGDATAANPLTATLEIEASEPGTLEDLEFDANGWRARITGVPTPLSRGKTGTMLEAVADDPTTPLVLRYFFNGMPYEKSLDLSPEGLSLLHTPGTTRRLPGAGGRPAELDAAGEVVPPGAAPSGPPKPERIMNDADDPPRTQARDIRVHGRLVYTRSDNVTVGADGVTCYVYDEDNGPDELLTQTATNSQGYFDVTFTWDPCFACDGEPDLYVLFESWNTKVEVETATLEVNYTWYSPQTDDYTGTDLDLGTQVPAAWHQALHILTNLTRTWRWFNALGYDTPETDAQWPDGTSGAWYTPGFQEIHISTEHEWREPTHAHEYGHHWQNNFAVLTAPDYCNGICDTGGCGHCLFCRETATDALSEGWGDWIADVLTRSFAPGYGIASQFFLSFESVRNCQEDGTLHDPTITEGFLAAAMRDIEDATQDDDPLVAGNWTDALAMGNDEIVTTLDVDHPTTAMGFLQAFKARYAAQHEDIWETAKNNGYELDVADPGVVTNLVSTSHAAPSTDTTPDFTWTRAPDTCSGVDAYSIAVTAAAALPDAVAELGNVTAHTAGPLAPGTYFFCIRARDRAGRWSPNFASVQFTVAEQPVAIVAGLEEVRATSDAVVLVWHVSGALSPDVEIQRSTGDGLWALAGVAVADARDRVRFEDRDVRAGRRYGYRLVAVDETGPVVAGETWVDVPAASRLALDPPEVGAELRFGLTLPGAAPARLTVVDVAGRVVASRDIGSLGAGTHDIALEERVAAGVYLVQLEQSGQRVVRRAVVVR